ncbi:hypothetical protein X942_5945 [Burkholderia pseudomallei MSHR5596]|uniref:Uncharacterized protein n=2 Tax=Burkholderia pseudomallei TaxID=28450 RepID=A0AA40JJH9_BURPE|nr:hypothetical protein [Burkholderia pseudomallei]KGS72884.1 hypothetical protein X942_5945 [Burkholderia pseudomallei MSHR5596]KGX17072.1 hypothetical protein Y036_6179 [Burkholderia pseudomallei]
MIASDVPLKNLRRLSKRAKPPLNKVWDALVTAIKMNDKVMSLAGTIKDQQVKIGGLTERVIRLEATLELLMRVVTTRSCPDHKQENEIDMSDKAKIERERCEQPGTGKKSPLGAVNIKTAVVCIFVGAAVFAALFGFPVVMQRLARLVGS